MALPQSTGVLAALDRAVTQFPNLTVINADDCLGYEWLVDPVETVIYVRSSEACTWSTNLLDAIDAFTAHVACDDARAGSYPQLRLILGGGEDALYRSARTGTHNR